MLPEGGFLGMILGATLGVQIVLVFLALMSMWSWTIIVHKLIVYRRVKGQVARGYEAFSDAEDLALGLQSVGREEDSPLARVGLLAMQSFRKLELADVAPDRKRMLASDTLRRVLRRGVSAEMKHLSSSLSFLATCANAAPFIGLFGTVWGIMHAFHSIGLSQSAALATVAPGISEALVTTAIGLVVAIPATIAYNFLLSELGEVETELVNFAGAFLNRVEREVSWAPNSSRDQ
ncbi:MotA/TolQ/ExbB proton channel family protein [Humidesulfovibrio sp.]|uniref:MotA/TolQ/ExbB proton channel family protein n=1 Tax=Humidesulfovibrio sp. TaxID=2910988 RepID=UPI00280B2E73|nr:MotA/TolQ/ExbB proton channel family protein [Humidesulfovibrio sp.]